jgi:hypothetical protein
MYLQDLMESDAKIAQADCRTLPLGLVKEKQFIAPANHLNYYLGSRRVVGA